MVLLGTARGPWKGVQRSVVEICKVLPNYSNLNGLFSMNRIFLDKINALEGNWVLFTFTNKGIVTSILLGTPSDQDRSCAGKLNCKFLLAV